MGVDPSTMVQLIDELEAAGLAKRQPHPSDRRAREVVLTAKGRRLRERGRPDGEPGRGRGARRAHPGPATRAAEAASARAQHSATATAMAGGGRRLGSQRCLRSAPTGRRRPARAARGRHARVPRGQAVRGAAASEARAAVDDPAFGQLTEDRERANRHGGARRRPSRRPRRRSAGDHGALGRPHLAHQI